MKSTGKFSYGRKDKKLFLLLALVYLIFELLALLKTSYFIIKGERNVRIPFDLFLLDWIIILVFMFVVIHSTRRMLNSGISWSKIVVLHVIFAFLINTISRALIEVYLFLSLPDRTLSHLTTEYMMDRFMAYIDVNYLIYFVMVGIIYLYYYSEQARYSEKQKRIVENELLNTQLKLLNSQIQPHFLFNTINCIVSLIKTNPEKATETLVDLSEFLRETLYIKEDQFILVKTELHNLRKYCRIIKTRFEDKLVIKQHISYEVLNIMIPPFIIQPIFENAIKHGFSGEKEVLEIEITMNVIHDSHLNIEIFNTGEPIKNSVDISVGGFGISSIRNRLRSLYRNNYTFVINNSESGSGVTAKIILPLAKKDQKRINDLKISS